MLHYEVLEESSPGAANGILCARAEFPNHDGWVGIGFSDDGSMTGSSIATTAVVGVPSSGTVSKYSVTARDKSGVTLMESQTLRGTSIFVDDDDTTIMTFVKLLSEAEEVEILTSGLNHFIAAKGGEFFLGDYHTPHFSNRQPGIEKDFSEDVPTSSPTFAPTISVSCRPGCKRSHGLNLSLCFGCHSQRLPSQARRLPSLLRLPQLNPSRQ